MSLWVARTPELRPEDIAEREFEEVVFDPYAWLSMYEAALDGILNGSCDTARAREVLRLGRAARAYHRAEAFAA